MPPKKPGKPFEEPTISAPVDVLREAKKYPIMGFTLGGSGATGDGTDGGLLDNFGNSAVQDGTLGIDGGGDGGGASDGSGAD